jgi:peptidoglycan hydrolase-like protein with peptidoglycan-binding domain
VKVLFTVLTALAIALGLSLGSVGTANADPGIAWIGPHVHAPEAVRCVQSAVGAQVDGQYGNETMHKIRVVQQSAGLLADGVVGPYTGDYLLPNTYDPAYCAKWIPTHYVFQVDDSTTPAPPPAAAGVNGPKPDGVIDAGKPMTQCIYNGVKGQLLGATKIAKVIWKRKLPSPGEWLRAPNPIIFGGRLTVCYIFGV